MKILKIEFENINNLKGTHQIDFQTMPLSHAGIFAIIGPTGSGKSTLLDVITLALFNRIPRFQNKITKKEVLDLGSVMTHHSKQAIASIKYEVKGNQYTSTWELSKTRTGTYRDYNMTIYDAQGKPLDLKKKEVPEQNEQIIGLKYDQFIKSIILSQGEFARFIKANNHERGKLLEDLTGSSIYRDLGMAAFQKSKELKAKLELIKSNLGVIQLLESDDRKSIEKELTAFEKEKSSFEQKQKKLELSIQKKEQKNKRTEQLENKQQELQNLQVEKQNFAPSLAKLKLDESLNPLKADLGIYESVKTNKKELSEGLEKYKAQQEEAKKNLNIALSEMSTLSKQEVSRDNFQKVMSDFEKEIGKLDHEILTKGKEGKEQRIRINKKIDTYQLKIDHQVAPDEAMRKLENEIEACSKILNQEKITWSTLEDFQSKLKAQRELLDQYEKLQHFDEHITSFGKVIKQLSDEISTSKESQQKIIPLLAESREHIESLEKNIQLLNQKKIDDQKIIELEKLRTELQDGEACPLCGSIEHPYTHHLPDIKSSEIDIEIKKAKEKQKEKQKIASDLEKSLGGLESSLKIFEKNFNDNKEELAITIKNKEAFAKENQIPSSMDGKEIRTQQVKLKEQIQKWEVANLAQQNKERFEIIQGDFKVLSKTMSDYLKLKKTRKEKFDGDDVSAVCNDIQNRYQSHMTSIESIAAVIEKDKTNLSNAEKSLSKIEAKLEPKLSEFKVSSIADLLSLTVSDIEIKSLKNQQENLLKKESSISTEIKNLEKEIKELTKDAEQESEENLEAQKSTLDSLKKELGALTEKLGENREKIRKDDEAIALQSSKLKEIQEFETQSEKWNLLSSYIGDANGNKFANFAQGITLQNLLALANKRLQSLSDRYLLAKPLNEGSLRVIDQYQGNIYRAVSTLSGGETFLISLALALSLSDMASKNISLDHLFIDEGFGTLDQDTLDVAMNTLEKLQSESQKTVGVISHVDALKERIQVQIKMIKNQQGHSSIEIIS